jgi:hypothetical protein
MSFVSIEISLLTTYDYLEISSPKLWTFSKALYPTTIAPSVTLVYTSCATLSIDIPVYSYKVLCIIITWFLIFYLWLSK